MDDDFLTPEHFERLLTALLDLPQAEQASYSLPQASHLVGDGAAQLLLELVDTALHSPPAWPQRMAAVEYFCKHARCRLVLDSLQDLQALLDQYPQSEDGDLELSRLLWNMEERAPVQALRVLAWFTAAYDITELGQWHAWMATPGFEEALREALDVLGAVAAVLLWQARSGRTDHAWVLRFARGAMGRSTSEGNAMLAFREAADAMGVAQLALARRVAQFERAAVGISDAPNLRLMWWKIAADTLQVHIVSAQTNGESGGELAVKTRSQAIGGSADWRVELSPAAALRYNEAGVVVEQQMRNLTDDVLSARLLRLRQRSWAQGLWLWLEIEGQGWLSAAHQAFIAERFEAAGMTEPRLRQVSNTGDQGATWVARWHWERALWMPLHLTMDEVTRWAQDTALNAAEHWQMMSGLLDAKSPLYMGNHLIAYGGSEASNEKKF